MSRLSPEALPPRVHVLPPPLFLTVVLACVLLAPGVVQAGQSVDSAAYASLLARHVRNGRVAYKGLKEDEARLDAFLEAQAEVRTGDLTPDESLAFHINAYNACTIKLILASYPGVKSIRDLGSILQSPWKKKICRLNGEALSLDDIEHGILLARFKDPRIHFVLCCAANGCPPLRGAPYQGARPGQIDRLLDQRTGEFVNNPANVVVREHTLYVSALFDWFRDDFNRDPAAFILRYANDDLRRSIEGLGPTPRIAYLPFDWDLNGE